MKRVLMLSGICILLAVGLMLWGFAEPAPIRRALAPHALLLVDDDTGSFLMQLRKGLQEAVGELEGRLSLETVASLPQGQLDTAPYTAVYLWMADPLPYAQALREQAVPVIVLGQALRGEYCLVFDEAQGVRQLGLLAQRQRRPGSAALVADSADPAQAVRLASAQALMGDAPYLLQSPDALDPAPLREAAYVLALSGRAVDRLAELKLAGLLPEGLPIFGVEAEENRVRYMEAGLLQGVAVTSPYAMGYAAGDALRLIAINDFKPALRQLGMQLVTAETMYDAQHVKEIFPLLQ